ncbi:MAG: orotate phosphoribosyltransferase [Candidatus Margulisiibacteriota bacterium]|nr:MAG: orotate phosphoribosyltransferase [Candidatus Margulisbacteria bacterium GWD2_39_127]OGI03120.1 MAG: orotate phosphoribosyltransferase [Candidatus Margulisbacteria bacterium GWF2_38_17]OGI11677.1 MAG: orotate phosphoribosyltransferase [Candidatus Margulisbacteria bacterium GWE2_39_32]PZM83777.1 MAG: orotate phosphoribosyltransferase [Candidatus Margulisiibacteriota bacterium]HAR63031.1 orotate phosphoribosyltransferase [Candidatus Margulisiibacteriota bacterium]
MDKRTLGKKILDSAYLEGDFTLRSGKKSKYYLDKYLFATKPDILAPLAKELAKKLPSLDSFDRLAGPELGAVALVAALSIEIGKPFIIVRKGQKGYGTDKVVEGEIHAGEKVVLVEDILTTAGAAITAAENLRSIDIDVKLILGVIDREQGARENIEKAGFVMDSVFTKTELGIG